MPNWNSKTKSWSPVRKPETKRLQAEARRMARSGASIREIASGIEHERLCLHGDECGDNLDWYSSLRRLSTAVGVLESRPYRRSDVRLTMDAAPDAGE